MTASTRPNNVRSIDTTNVSSYPDISTIENGVCCYSCCCCCCHDSSSNHGQQHHHDDYQIEDDSTPSPKRTSCPCPFSKKKRPTVSITSFTSNGSPCSPYFQNQTGPERKPCGCASKLERRKKNGKKEKDIKLRRLILLIAVFVLYVSLGAVVFNALEAGPERERKEELEDTLAQFMDKYPCVNKSDLHELLQKAVVDSEIVYYVVENKTHLDRWDFSGAFGFVVSVVTTIGFGNLSPFTMEGKAVCVIYALFGIPLTLLVLGGLGEKMAFCVSKCRKCKYPMCHHTPRVNRMMNVISISTLGAIVIFIAPALMFTYVEQWHFLESLYFCFTTLSTIGFGDYVIGIHETTLKSMYVHEFYEVIAYVWILLGLAYLSLVYRYISDTMAAKATKVEKKTIKRFGTDLSKITNSSTPASPDSSSSVHTTIERYAPHTESVHTEDTELISDGDKIEEPTEV